MKILVLNGVNLDQLHRREKQWYGKKDLKAIETLAKERFPHIQQTWRQTNDLSQLIQWIHNAEKEGFQGIILNAGAWSHYEYALQDAIALIDLPVIEVHLSNIYAREPFRHVSVIASVCQGTITGFQYYSYLLALHYFNDLLSQRTS